MKPLLLNKTLVVVGCAAGLVGAALGVHLSRHDSSACSPAAGHTRHAAAPARVSQTVSDDPRAVALRYVLSGQALLDAGPAGVDAVLSPIVALSARRELVDENRRQVAQVRTELAAADGPIRWRQAPLAVRVDTSGDDATVEVWHVGVLSAPGAVPPQAHWATSTVELAHGDGAWKVTSETVVDGPAPLNASDAAPTDSAAFDDTLAGFSAPDGA
jgi:hypothetical protein